MRGEGGLAAEFDALGFRIGPAPRRALGDASAFELRRDAKHGENKPDVVSTTGSAIERRPAPARCMSRAITRRSVVSRERRSTAGMMTTRARQDAKRCSACTGEVIYLKWRTVL